MIDLTSILIKIIDFKINPIADLLLLSMGAFFAAVGFFVLLISYKHKCSIKEIHKRLEGTSLPKWILRIFIIGTLGAVAAQLTGYGADKNNQILTEGTSYYTKKNNSLFIDTTTESPQIITLSWGLNTKGECDEGAIDCFSDVDLYTVKTSFGYSTRRTHAFNSECIINIIVLRKKLKVKYQDGTCDTGTENRFTLSNINGVYTLN